MVTKMAYVSTGTVGRTEHFTGMPPTGGEFDRDTRVPMPAAWVLLMEEGDGGFYIFRYSSTGQFAGDTWHESESHALDQAEFEFNVSPSAWADTAEDLSRVLARLFPSSHG